MGCSASSFGLFGASDEPGEKTSALAGERRAGLSSDNQWREFVTVINEVESMKGRNMAKDIQCEVRNIISDIEEKAADGNYIYRGEPECYAQSPFDGKVSSSLWRQLQCNDLPSMIGLTFDYNT